MPRNFPEKGKNLTNEGESVDLQPLKSELISAAKLKEPAERSIRIAAIIAEALRSIGQDPILVGGAAVEFYTQIKTVYTGD